MSKTCVLAVFGLVLSACAGAFIGDREQFYGDPDDAARVTVMRKSQMLGAAGALLLELDGKPIARLRTGDFIEFPVRPGDHFLLISNTGGQYPHLHKFKAETGQSYYFRTGVGGEGTMFFIEELSSQRGSAEVQRGYDEIRIQ